MTIDQCRKRLAVLWFAGTFLIALVLVFQTMLGKYAEHVKGVWEWFTPTAVPTLTLMIGVFATQMVGKAVQMQTVDRFLFFAALGLSLVYLLGVAVPIFCLPFICTEPVDMVAFLRQSDYWLRPGQGLVTAALGAFFVSGAKAD